MEEQTGGQVNDLLAGVTDAMVTEAAAFREDAAPGAEAGESTRFPEVARSAISGTAYDFIVRWETGGRAYYERVIKQRPVWPGFASGITIGCGYDLGYHRTPQFELEWTDRLNRADFDRLARTIGFRTVAPDREQKVQRARALIGSLADIVIPWATAIDQFDEVKLPTLLGQLYGRIDNLDRIHPHCRGALLSIVFNRGHNAFTNSGDRFAEMRAIRSAMNQGTAEAFAAIPALFRSMKRIWGANSSLAERREGEAKLFESGLREMRLLEMVQVMAAAESHEREGQRATELHEDIEIEPSDDADVETVEEILHGLESLEAGRHSIDTVRWNQKDDEQPDYRHLDTALAGTTFEFTGADLDLLIRANEFAPRPGKVLFALRGAALVNGPRTDTASVVITDQRPDHRTFRCVMGVYDPANGKLAAFPASTVPNAAYVYRCYDMARRGTPIKDLTGNILPTGCYTYTVGTHRAGQRGEIPTVLRLSTTATGASRIVVLRSLFDVVYDRFDEFPIAVPADNIHPGQMRQGFSSAGCLTMPGFYAEGRHTGIWKDFRVAAGFDDGPNGKQFSLLLVTGLDAAMAARARIANAGMDGLRRLRHGSAGARVAALQGGLNLASDPQRLVGPVTRRVLVERQARVLGWADGIYSPAMDELLGLNVYGTA